MKRTRETLFHFHNFFSIHLVGMASVVMRRRFLICQKGGGAPPCPPFWHPCLEIHLINIFFSICRSSLTTICSEIIPLVIHPSHPTSIVCIESFELSSWDKLPKLLFVVTFSMLLLSTINLLFCDEWHIGLTVFLWASTTLTKVMWCLRYYEIYTLSRLLDICHIGLFYFHMIANDDAKFLL